MASITISYSQLVPPGIFIKKYNTESLTMSVYACVYKYNVREVKSYIERDRMMASM